MNATMAKFGHPETLVAAYDSWVVLLRPQQATLGALVLVCREAATAFSQISPAAFGELGTAVRDIEAALTPAFAYDKINYLMLMMVDLDVHFHVIPRYAGERTHGGHTFADAGWPGQPNLASNVTLSEDEAAALAAELAARWRA